MAISFVAAGAVSTGSNPTVAVPAGYQQGDLLLIVTAGTATPSTPSGWAQVSAQGAGQFITILRKFATGSEASVTLTLTGTSSKAVMVAYRGVSATDTLSATYATGTGTTATPNTLTTTYANEYVLSIYADATTATDWTANASTTERVNSSSTASVRGILIADESQAAAGTSTARAATLSVSNTWASIALSIIPSGRYWVGGSGTWNTTSTTNWSFSSGGSSGAPVPTAQDTTVFDQASTYTVTMTGALLCLDITVSAGTVTFATGTTPTLTASGSMTLLAGTVWNSTATVFFNATSTGKTATTNGVTISGPVTFNGTGGGWTLGSALTTSGALNVTAGTFDTSSTGNYAVSCTQFIFNGSTARTIKLNNSTVTATSAAANAVSASTSTNLTFNAGTSQINLTGATSGIAIPSASFTFYNVAFTSTTAGTRTITGSHTYNNLAITGPSTASITTVTLDVNQIINGTLSTTGTAGNRRIFISGGTYGLSINLAVNSAPSMTDIDFRGIYVTGTAAPISGTRIGNRGECRGITFDTPKTVYWSQAAGGNWSDNAWASGSGGSPSTDYFPLAQDTATFVNTGLNTSATVTWDNVIVYTGTVDMSGRTNAMTLATGSVAPTMYGNWTNGSGTSLSGTGIITFSGGSTQTITSAGKSFTQPITVDTYGGTVQLGDALNIGSNTLTVTNGTFDTKNYNVTAGILSSNNSNVRTITLGSSTVTLSSSGAVTFTTSTNLTFNANTSQITITTTNTTFAGGSQTFYNLSFTSTVANTQAITGANTFNNLTFTAPASAGLMQCTFAANQTINGTLTCAGATAVRRIFLLSSLLNTQRTLTVGSLSATDCDFQDIKISGAASGSSPTRAGNCGNNSGITFPAAKTVYWNLAGAQNWSATGWCSSSGGTPDVNQFPLAQDTAVFDNTGSVTGTITVDANWNIGTFDASARTSAMTLTIALVNFYIYGDWKFGTGVTQSASGAVINFSKIGTQTITSNGVQFGCFVTVAHPSSTVQLADALTIVSTYYLILTQGTFDAVSYNVTAGQFSNVDAANVLKMGSGTWTLSSTGNVWNCVTAPTLIAGTSTIVLSNTTTTARTFAGASLYYNKLTIGGTTGTSTLTITGANIFGELASTKTVAHTITFPSSNTTTIGKWSVTGTAGNVVTLAPSTAATTYTLVIAGPANSGIDYLSISYCAVSTTSPGEFYVGVNSTNTAGNTGAIIFTAAPTPRTLYWVGGTGNWSSTTKWSTASGGASGAAIPTSLDAVNFDSASNATAYTATIDAGVTIARCASFTMAGPASGNVTFAGTVPIAFHGNVSFSATGITRTYTADMYWAGNSSYTFTTNGVALGSTTTVIGGGATWTLGSVLAIGASSLAVTYGAFDTGNYNVTANQLASTGTAKRSITLGSSTLTLATSASVVSFGTTASTRANLTLSAGTSLISCSAATTAFTGNNQTFYDVSFTSAAATGIAITGANTFNTLAFTGRTTAGITPVTFDSNQTITTLTIPAGTAAAYRTFLASDTIGTTRTLTVTTLTAGATDIDFRDITIAGTAAPISGTRFGDAKGNSGITFPGAKTVYYRATGSANWGATGTGSWSATSGSAFDGTQFPLAQDTAIFPAATYPASGSTTAINDNYNIGTIDMSLRTSNVMVLATGTNAPIIYGNWLNGTGISLSGTSVMTFAGRSSQTITSAGKAFSQPIVINTVGGAVTLQDAFTSNAGAGTATINLLAGTFDANTYNITINTAIAVGGIATSGTLTRTLALGSGTITLVGSGTQFSVSAATNLTVTGTGTITFTAATSKTFVGGSISYSGITINQGGAGALTISGNNTFKDITNTYSATGAATISLGATTQTLTQFTGTGTSGKLLTLSGASTVSVATLILSSGTVTTPDYLSISNVRAYSLSTTWYAGANSVNLGSLGWIFSAAGGVTYNSTITESATATDAIASSFLFFGNISESITAADEISSVFAFSANIAESATATDSVSSLASFLSVVVETATATDTVSSQTIFVSAITENATATDSTVGYISFPASITETSTATDSTVGYISFPANIAESSTATDSVFGQVSFVSSVAETSTATDLTVGYISFPANIAETSTATDSAFGQVSFVSSVAETSTISDSTVGYISFPANITETSTATDATVGYISFPANIAETSTATDLVSSRYTVAAVVAETSTATDTAASFAVFTGAVSETATATDSIFSRAVFSGTVVETSTATDAVSAKATFQVSVAETSNATDDVSAFSTINTSVVESATGTDLVVSSFAFFASVAETATASDSTVGYLVLPASVSETLTLTDTTSATAVFNSSVSETLVIVDIVSPGLVFNSSIVESVLIYDSVQGVYQWNLIPTSQDAGWANVASVQNANWINVTTADPYEVTLVDTVAYNASGSSYILTDVNFGAEALSRELFVVIVGRYGGTRSLTSVTINGVAATLATTNYFGTNTALGQGLAFAGVPTGTSGSVSITLSGTISNVRLLVYRVTGRLRYGSNMSASARVPNSANVSSLTIPSGSAIIPNNGFLIGSVAALAQPTVTSTGVTSGMTQVGAYTNPTLSAILPSAIALEESRIGMSSDSSARSITWPTTQFLTTLAVWTFR